MVQTQQRALDIMRRFAADVPRGAPAKRGWFGGGGQLERARSTSTADSVWARPTCLRRRPTRSGPSERRPRRLPSTPTWWDCSASRPRATRWRREKLVCIDEFELDDVGDTLIVTRLVRELMDRGTWITVTSNTLPEALGEGRFAAEDFRRDRRTGAALRGGHRRR